MERGVETCDLRHRRTSSLYFGYQIDLEGQMLGVEWRDTPELIEKIRRDAYWCLVCHPMHHPMCYRAYRREGGLPLEPVQQEGRRRGVVRPAKAGLFQRRAARNRDSGRVRQSLGEAEEQRAGTRDACAASLALLTNVLNQKGVSYESFILSI